MVLEDIYEGTGAEVKKAGLEDVRRTTDTSDKETIVYLAVTIQISTSLPLAHKVAVPIQTLAVPHLDLPCFVPWYLTLWSCICDGELRTIAVD